MDWVEIVGYVASLLVAVSLMMSNILRLRIINSIGSAFFSIYGYILGAYPVFAVNFFIFCVNLFYLWRMHHQSDAFQVLSAEESGPEYLKKFFQFYKDDILKYAPEFQEGFFEECETTFILRNLVPVNLVVYKKQKENEVELFLDYAIPAYRDFKNARFLFKYYKDYYKDQGIEWIVTKSTVKKHISYLKRNGFKESENGVFARAL